jgi:hypothetical protein
MLQLCRSPRSRLILEVSQASRQNMLLAALVCDTTIFLSTVVVFIYGHNLWGIGNRSSYYVVGLKPEYFHPSLPAPGLEDGIRRYYNSPERYNPLSWNCMLQKHTTNHLYRAVSDKCKEGIAARDLMAVLVALSGSTLVLHAVQFWMEKRNGHVPWRSQRLGSDENVVAESARE